MEGCWGTRRQHQGEVVDAPPESWTWACPACLSVWRGGHGPALLGLPDPAAQLLDGAWWASQLERLLQALCEASRAVTPGLLIAGGSAFCNCPATWASGLESFLSPSVPPPPPATGSALGFPQPWKHQLQPEPGGPGGRAQAD